MPTKLELICLLSQTFGVLIRWLVDAILEYTGMARLPGVFLQEGQVAATVPLFSANSDKDVEVRTPDF